MKLGFMAMMSKQKAQYSHWVSKMSPRSKRAQWVWSYVKVMLTVFFDCEGIMHHEFVPYGQTVNKEYYLKVMKKLRGSGEKKGWFVEGKKNGCSLMTALAHFSLLIHDFLT